MCFIMVCLHETTKITETWNHTLTHKPNFIYFEPWCLYVPIQYIQYIHLAMRDCTEICYSSAYIRGTKMYTKETHTCHFTTVKWYTRYTRGKSMADGWLHQYTHTHTHTHTPTQTLFHACSIVCTHTRSRFKTLLREEKGSFRFS